MELKDLLAYVRIPKKAENLGWGISARIDGRSSEMRIAKAIARQSNPGCKIEYSETQWEKEEGEGDWHHMFWVDAPDGDHYQYSIQAIQVLPVLLVAAAFYDLNEKHYMVVATLDCRKGHVHVVTQQSTCTASTN